MFLSEYENKISNEFLKNGYIIKKSKEQKILFEIRKLIIDKLKKEINFKNKLNEDDLLNNIHKNLKLKDLNNTRLKLINEVTSTKKFKNYFIIYQRNT